MPVSVILPQICPIAASIETSTIMDNSKSDAYFSSLLIITVLYLFARIGECYYLTILEHIAIDGQSYERSVHVPPLQSCRSGIDVQQSESLVVFYFKYM